MTETGDWTLDGLFLRLGAAIDEIGAKRVVIDTLELLFGAFSNSARLRAELGRLFSWLKARGVTAVITGERGEGTLTRHSIEEYISCYRLGGDEFCALLRDDVDERILPRCVEALSESGEAFTIASSFGSVLLPIETADADAALHLADERLDKDRGSGSVSVGQQTRDLALTMLSVQEPDLRHHSAHVAALRRRHR